MNVRALLNDPAARMRIHSWGAVIWFALTVVTTAWALYDPENRYLLAWVITMSGYANFVGHWSSREGAAPSAKEDEA